MSRSRSLSAVSSEDPKTIPEFYQEVKAADDYEFGHWDSDVAVELKVDGGISRAEYMLYQNNLDPNLDQRLKQATSWCCIRNCSCEKKACCCPTPKFKCGCPDPPKYFILVLFVCVIAFMLESDFAALIYFITEGCLSSNDPLEKILSLYALISNMVCYVALFLTIDQCVKCWSHKFKDDQMRKNEPKGEESCFACRCPVMTLGPADNSVQFQSSVVRQQMLRMRWYMLVPFARMLFIVVQFGNVDFKGASKKTSDDMRREKLQTVRSITVLGMVNTLTLTVPNIAIAIARRSSGQGSSLDDIFFIMNCISLSFTTFSMCYGVLNAIVNKIDTMDKILNDVAEATEQQLQVAKYANSHLEVLYEIHAQIFRSLANTSGAYTGLTKPRFQVGDPSKRTHIGPSISTYKSLLASLRAFVPEDITMWNTKRILVDLLEKAILHSRTEFQIDQTVQDSIEIMLWELHGGVYQSMITYCAELERACNIADMDWKSFAGNYTDFLSNYKKTKKHALDHMTIRVVGVAAELDTDLSHVYV